MAFKALYIIFLVFIYNAGYIEPAAVATETEPVVAENDVTPDMADQEEFPAEQADENINLNITRNAISEKNTSKHSTIRAKPKGRKIVAAITFLLLAAMSAYLYILKDPLYLKEKLKSLAATQEETFDGQIDITPKRRVEPPADILLKVRPKILETAKENLTLEVLNWNMAFDLDFQTNRDFDNMVGDRYLDWDDKFMSDIATVIQKKSYDKKFSEQDISNIVSERQNILNDKIKLHLGTADPSLVLATTETLLSAIATVEKEVHVELKDLKRLVNKIDGTRLLKLDNIDYVAPLREIIVNDPTTKRHIVQFLEDCETKLLPKLILVNNYVAPYAEFISQWAAKIKQPDEDVLADFNAKVNKV